MKLIESNLVKEDNQYWHFPNNNKYAKRNFKTLESAEKAYLTLKDCEDCINSKNCKNCYSCHWCENCNNCNNCVWGKNLNNCRDCGDSINCNNCFDSNGLVGCIKCEYCSRCDMIKNGKNLKFIFAQGQEQADVKGLNQKEAEELVNQSRR
jgi:hypothetical protein